MQKQQTVSVGGGSIIVKELRVKDVRYLMDEAQRFEAMDLKTLFFGHFDEVLALLKPLLETDIDITELSFSELEEIKTAFLGVNESFLNLTGLKAVFQPPIPPTSSTERVSPSLDADTQAVLNMAGVSS